MSSIRKNMRAPSGKELEERFQDRILDEEKTKAAYQTNPKIETKLKISHARDGQLKIVCKNAKYARYLMDQLKAIRSTDTEDKDKTFNCFFANKEENCACFYITSTNRTSEGAINIEYWDQRGDEVIPQKKSRKELEDEEAEEKKYEERMKNLTKYGVYQAKNKELSLNCPGYVRGREKVLKLLGLSVDNKDVVCDGSAIYFNPRKLPFQPGNQYVLETTVLIEDGLRPAYTEADTADEKKSATTQPSTTHAYTGKDTQLVLTALIKMIHSNDYLSYKGDDEDGSRDEMIIYKGTAYKQSGYHGSDYETLSLRWVDDNGELKLAVSYYSYQDQFMCTAQKSACYLLSFNSDKQTISTELIYTPTMHKITLASFQNSDGSHTPIDGSAFVPSGADIIDALTEWAREINNDRLKPQDATALETGDDFISKSWQKSRIDLTTAMFKNNLNVASTPQTISALAQIFELYSSMENSTEKKAIIQYIARMEAVRRIHHIVQTAILEYEADNQTTSDTTESKEVPASEVSASDTPAPEVSTSDVPAPAPVSSPASGPKKPFKLSPEKTAELKAQVMIIYNNEPTWKEKAFLENILRTCGCMLLITIPLVLWWNHYQTEAYKKNILDKVSPLAPDETFQEGPIGLRTTVH